MTESEFIANIKEHQRIVHKICALYATTPDDREDLFQEILMQAWKAAPQYRGAAQFSTWLYKIGLNTAVSHYRKAGFRLQSAPIDGMAMVLPETNAEPNPALEALYQAIGELGKVDKAIIMLWLDEFDYASIGEVLGISENHVAVKMLRMKEKLKTLIKKHL